MHKDIPIKDDSNDSELGENDEDVQHKRYLCIEGANFWKRYTVDVIAVLASLVAILDYLNKTVDSGEGDHENELEEHHLNEIEVETYGFVYLVDI